MKSLQSIIESCTDDKELMDSIEECLLEDPLNEGDDNLPSNVNMLTDRLDQACINLSPAKKLSLAAKLAKSLGFDSVFAANATKIATAIRKSQGGSEFTDDEFKDIERHAYGM
jgi:hypothetical protein